MPAVKIIEALGNGLAKELGDRFISVLPRDGDYTTFEGKPYLVEAVIHALDSNRVLIRVHGIEMTPQEQEKEKEKPRVIEHRQEPPPALPEVHLDDEPFPVDNSEDDWFYK